MESENLNELFFEKILRDCLKIENPQVFEVKKKIATNKGENYLSDTYRVNVKYSKILEYKSENKEENLSFIVKLLSTENLGLGSNTVPELFRTELKTFLDVLPKMEKILSESVAPRFFFGDPNTSFIVMEDLATKGFSTQDRKKCLSLAHTILAIEKLAVFHAGSVALAEENPELVRSFLKGNIQKDYPESFFCYLQSCVENLCESIEEWTEDEYKQASSKLKKIKNVLKERLLEAYKYDSNEFCVLNHGDIWTSNILFKHDEKGEPTDTLFVDFQMPIYTSPAIDLQHFLSMCPEIGIKHEKDDYLLEKYLKILENTMKKIGCKTKSPTLEELKIAMFKRRIYTILAGLIYYPRSVNETFENLDELLKSGDKKLDVFKKPESIQAMRKMVKILHDRDYLEY